MLKPSGSWGWSFWLIYHHFLHVFCQIFAHDFWMFKHEAALNWQQVGPSQFSQPVKLGAFWHRQSLSHLDGLKMPEKVMPFVLICTEAPLVSKSKPCHSFFLAKGHYSFPSCSSEPDAPVFGTSGCLQLVPNCSLC